MTIHAYPDIASLNPEARRLLDTAESTYPEFSADWFDNLQRTVFAGDSSVRYYVAERDGAPRALLPVRLARHGRRRRIETLGNYYTTLYSPILEQDVTAADLAALLQTASNDHGKADEVRFAPLDPTTHGFTLLQEALRQCGWRAFTYFCFGNWTLEVTGNFQEYLSQRPGELRNTLARKGKRFAAAGGTLDIHTTPAEAETAIAAYEQVYARSWKTAESYPDFIPGLIRWLAQRGWLRLGVARLHGEPIAAALWIVANGTAHIYKLAHDENHAVHAPGSLLTAHLMAHVIDHDRVRKVDYLSGDDLYKQLWMTHRTERRGIVAYNPHTLLGLTGLLREIAGRALRSLW